jgi:hypothetical protein
MLDMSSIMPIFTTPSEILVFSSDLAAYAATNKNTANATIISHLFIVTSWVVDAFTLAILRIASRLVRGHAKGHLPRQLASAAGFHFSQHFVPIERRVRCLSTRPSSGAGHERRF